MKNFHLTQTSSKKLSVRYLILSPGNGNERNSQGVFRAGSGPIRIENSIFSKNQANLRLIYLK